MVLGISSYRVTITELGTTNSFEADFSASTTVDEIKTFAANQFQKTVEALVQFSEQKMKSIRSGTLAEVLGQNIQAQLYLLLSRREVLLNQQLEFPDIFREDADSVR